MSRVGDADAAEQLARSYEVGAERLVEQMRTLERHLERCQWRGRSADRSRELLRDHAHRTHSTCREMQDLAADLRRYARAVRDREQQLRRLERRIRSWAAANPPDPQRWPNASIIRCYPPALDPAWEQIAQRLRTHGAVF